MRKNCLIIIIICSVIAFLASIPLVQAQKCKAVYMVDYVNGTPQIPVIEGAEIEGYSVYQENVTGNGYVKVWLIFDDDAVCSKRTEMKKHLEHVKDIDEDDQGEDENEQ